MVILDSEGLGLRGLAGRVQTLVAGGVGEAGGEDEAARISGAGGAAGDEEGPGAEGGVVEIPVVYDGPDLDEVAGLTGLSREQVIERHVAAEYLVGWLGFSPGFGYLTGLDPELHVPRRDSPAPRCRPVRWPSPARWPPSTRRRHRAGGGCWGGPRPSCGTPGASHPRCWRPASGSGSGRWTSWAIRATCSRPAPRPATNRSRPRNGSSRWCGQGRSRSWPTSAVPATATWACRVPVPRTRRACGWPIGWSATPRTPPSWS